MGTWSAQSVNCKSGETIVVRNATPTDASKLNDLATDVFRSSEYLITTPEEFSSYSEAQQVERVKKFEDDENALLLVAEHDGELVGMLDFQNGKRKRIAHNGSFGMSVRSSWRGKGLGKILLSTLIDWAKKNPTIELISLGVVEGNTSAIALYIGLGFKQTGREPHGVKLADGTYLADLSMSLKLEK